MSTSWLITNVLAAMLLPPFNGLLLIALGQLLWNYMPRFARACTSLGLFLVVVLSLPAVGYALVRTLEVEPASAADLKRAQAIVVLGGGRYRDAPEYGGDTVKEETLVRLRYAAKLHRDTNLPILVTGGKPDGGDISEASTMSRVLIDEFTVPVRWAEDASNNTRENAIRSAFILKRDGIQRVALVTHSWHMRRAMESFAEQGLTVIPAPTRFYREPPTLVDFLPSSYVESRYAIHEWIGILWYLVR